MSFGVLMVTAWFLVVAAVLVWQFAGGAFAHAEQERTAMPERAPELDTPAFAPALALATRYKRAKTPVCSRRRATAA